MYTADAYVAEIQKLGENHATLKLLWSRKYENVQTNYFHSKVFMTPGLLGRGKRRALPIIENNTAALLYTIERQK